MLYEAPGQYHCEVIEVSLYKTPGLRLSEVIQSDYARCRNIRQQSAILGKGGKKLSNDFCNVKHFLPLKYNLSFSSGTSVLIFFCWSVLTLSQK